MKDLFTDTPIWTDREFSHPERTIRLGSLFSGIGAIEHALKRLNIKTQIQFASDIEPNCKKATSQTMILLKTGGALMYMS